MVNTALRPDASLSELLAARARAASAPRLTADVVGGALVAGAVLVWRPSWWPLPLAAALCFAAFGVWGIADRELAAGHARGPLRAVRAAAAVLGAAAALLLAFGLVGLVVGPFQL